MPTQCLSFVTGVRYACFLQKAPTMASQVTGINFVLPNAIWHKNHSPDGREQAFLIFLFLLRLLYSGTQCDEIVLRLSVVMQ